MTASAYDRWVFDLDGTLVDVEPAYVQSVLERVGDRLGHRFSAWEAEAIWYGLGGTRDETLRRCGVDVEAFWAAFHAEEDGEARADASFLYEDAAAVGELAAPTVLVTHCQRHLTEPVLEALDIRDWFDAVVCCTPETGWKPDPAPVERALAAADARSGAGVLVGDGPHDVGAAWNAGLSAAHVERHDPARRGCCVRADHRVDAVDALVPG